MSTLHPGYTRNSHLAAMRELYSARPDAPVVDDSRRTTLRRTRTLTAGALHRAANRLAPTA
jgi:hypothetical protein